MPQTTSGAKTLLSGGVFLLFGVSLVILPTPLTMTAALFIPALYGLWSARLKRAGWLLLALLPALLGVVPVWRQGAVLYGCLVLAGVCMTAMLKRSRIGLAVVLPSCVLLSVFALGIVAMAQGAGVTPDQRMAQWLDQVMTQVNALYASILSPAEMTAFQAQQPLIEKLILRIFPALTATGFGFIVWLNLLIVAAARRLDLKGWRIPDWIVALFILAALATFAPHPLWQTAGYNLLLVVTLGYFFQGLAIVAFYMHAWRWTGLLRGIIYLLILSQFYIMIAVALGGLFDTWFYFRNRIRKEGEQL